MNVPIPIGWYDDFYTSDVLLLGRMADDAYPLPGSGKAGIKLLRAWPEAYEAIPAVRRSRRRLRL